MSDKLNWDKIRAEEMVARRRREAPIRVIIADAGDCAAHYVMNCLECTETRLRNQSWSYRIKPHAAEGDPCAKCGLEETYAIHSKYFEESVQAAKTQRKLRLQYMDSL
jgi:hypothetical protein